MALATFSVRMDEKIKNQFDMLCADFGMNASTAINVFARAVIREKKIPFDIASNEQVAGRAEALENFYALRAEARKNGAQGMTLDEINEEIRLARMEAKRV